LQILRLKPEALKQTCTSSKLTIQLPKTIFLDSAVFLEKNILDLAAETYSWSGGGDWRYAWADPAIL
jgi:hypothetical protein